MPLQHQVDAATLEDGLPCRLQGFRVGWSGTGKNGLVKNDDIPLRLARSERSVQPAGLRCQRAELKRRRTIQQDEANTLIIDEVCCRLDRLCAVGRQGELARPIGP